MKDQNKSKSQLISELETLRNSVSKMQMPDQESQKSEEKYRNLFDTMAQGVVYQTVDGKIISANAAAERILGLTIDQMQGRTSVDPRWKAIKEDGSDYPGNEHPAMISLKKGQPVLNTEMGIYHPKQCKYFWISIDAIPQFRPGEETPYQVYTMFNDITERKEVESALKEAEKKYRSIFQDVPVGIYRTTPDGQIIDANPALVSMLGFSSLQELQERNLEQIDQSENDYRRQEFKANLERNGELLGVESIWPAAENERIIVRENARLIRRKSGQPLYYDGTAENITKRKQAEEELLESERQYRALFEESPIPLWEEDFSLVKEKMDLLKQQGVKDFRKFFDEHPEKVNKYVGLVKILKFNKAVLELHEAKSRDDLLKGLYTVFTEKAFNIFKEELIAISEGRTKCEFETIGRTLTGKEKNVQLNWVVVPGYEETMEKVYVSTIDITERNLAEKALRESETKYRTLFEKSADALLIIKGGKFVDCNSATVDMLGYTNKKELLETHPSQLSPEKQPDGRISFEKANEMMSIAFDRGSHRFEWDHQRQNGEVFPVEVLLTSIPFEEGKFLHVVWRDKTERKLAEEEKRKLEKRLRRTQKLETIGTLAGGIAHDFNNILTPILGHTDMIISDLSEADPLRQNLNPVLIAANRAKDIVEQILLFSKQIEKERHPLSPHLIVREALKLLQSSTPTTIDIVPIIDSSCGKVMADATQIHQVVVNLCTNAWHAMEEKGGILTIELIQVEVNGEDAKLYTNLKEGAYARLTVQDTGDGMCESTIDRIFEPFFTTKAVDKGTGLGLSVVHGIVQNHKGDIFVHSEQGSGTVFEVYLPVIKTVLESKEEKPDQISTGGFESILVVDDDDMVGNILKQMLEKLGYTIDFYNKSKKALNHFQKNPHGYDLLISDLTMPDFTGIGLSEQIQKTHPGFPIIIMTGFGDMLFGVNQQRYGIKKVLKKPIMLDELASAIREALE